MTFKEAVSYGYLRRRGNYKGAPWVCNGRQFDTWKEALAEANEMLKRDREKHKNEQ